MLWYIHIIIVDLLALCFYIFVILVNFAHYKLELQGDKAEHDSYNRSEINLQIYMLYNPYVWRALRDVKGVPNIGLVYTVCVSVALL